MLKIKPYLLLAGLTPLILNGQAIAVNNWPATGQDTCYSNTEQVPCGNSTYPNQDADTSVLDLQPDQDITSVPGTVIDNVTGLQWIQDGTDSGRVDLAGAQVYIAGLNSSSVHGYSDWRLPTAQELSTLIDSGFTYDPDGVTIPFEVYGNFTVEGWEHWRTIFWSSNVDHGYSSPGVNDRILVRFKHGDVNGSSVSSYDGRHYVLAVREVTAVKEQKFTDQGGVVLDEVTGLMWQKGSASTSDGALTNYLFTWGSDGGCVGQEDPDGSSGRETNALCYCDNLSLGGYTDWRLPDRNELHSLFDYNQSEAPFIDALFTDTFHEAYSYYWTSTTAHADATTAWAGVFGSSYLLHSNDKVSNRSHVRCVRGFQSPSEPTPAQSGIILQVLPTIISAQNGE